MTLWSISAAFLLNPSTRHKVENNHPPKCHTSSTFSWAFCEKWHKFGDTRAVLSIWASIMGNSHHTGCWWVWGFKCQGRLTIARRLPCLLTLRHVGSWCQNLEIPHRLPLTRVEAEKLNIVGKLQIKLLLVVAIILQLGRRLLVSRAVSWELFTSNKIYSKGKQTEDRRHFKWLKQCKTQKSEKNMQ